MTPANRRARWPALPVTAFFGATWILLCAAGSARMFQDPGTFWHLLTGERILEHGLPHQDWLTFTFQGKPWIAHQWLAECAMALLQRLGGYDALLVAASAGMALLFAWLFRRLVERGVQERWAVLLAALAVMTSAGSIHIRPLLLSMGFFAGTFALLVDVEAGRARIPSLAWLLPMFVVWVNCHGAVLGGLATFGLAGVGWLIAWALGRPSPVRDRSSALQLGLLMVGAALTPLVNPYGLEMVRTWMAIVRSPVIAESIVEHASVWRTGAWYVLPLAAVYVAAFLGAPGARWRVTSVLPLVWLALMLQRVRHAPLFAIAATLAAAELLPLGSMAPWLARRRAEAGGLSRSWTPAASLVWFMPVLGLLLAGLHQHVVGGSLAGPARGAWPFELKAQIAAVARAAGPAAPILNDFKLGAFLSHEVPEVRIFGDDRCELYGEDFLRAWFEGAPGWYAGWVERFDVRLALAEHGSALERYLRGAPGWREVAGNSAAALFVRDVERPAPRGS